MCCVSEPAVKIKLLLQVRWDLPGPLEGELDVIIEFTLFQLVGRRCPTRVLL